MSSVLQIQGCYCKIIKTKGGAAVELVVKTFEQLNTRELYEILRVRAAVFVVEQDCAYQDVDGIDLRAVHAFLQNEGGIRAYLRLFEKDEHTAQMGRMLTVERGTGLGGRLLKEGIRIARDVLKKDALYIEAQCYAVGFYTREGFKVTSEEFLEDGIPHVQMMLEF